MAVEHEPDRENQAEADGARTGLNVEPQQKSSSSYVSTCDLTCTRQGRCETQS